MSEDTSRRVFGGVLIALGLVYFLKVIGVLNFSLGPEVWKYWPLGLIVVGIAIILRMRWLAVTFLILTVVFAVASGVNSISAGPVRELERVVPAEPGIDTVELDISYGAGEISIASGSADNWMYANITTADRQDPYILVKKDGPQASIIMERKASYPWGDDRWNILLSPDVELKLDLDYGAAKVLVDMTSLSVESVDIDSGATDTELVFGSEPTRVTIDTGASSVRLYFPQDAGVILNIDSGASSLDLDGFSKRDGTYYSPGYDESAENIEVTIDAGASSIEAGFY